MEGPCHGAEIAVTSPVTWSPPASRTGLCFRFVFRKTVSGMRSARCGSFGLCSGSPMRQGLGWEVTERAQSQQLIGSEPRPRTQNRRERGQVLRLGDSRPQARQERPGQMCRPGHTTGCPPTTAGQAPAATSGRSQRCGLQAEPPRKTAALLVFHRIGPSLAAPSFTSSLTSA